MIAYTVSGLLVGVVAGFFLGRAWAEYFRARFDAAQQYAQRRRYRGRTAAWITGALLILAGAIAFSYFVPS